MNSLGLLASSGGHLVRTFVGTTGYSLLQGWGYIAIVLSQECSFLFFFSVYAVLPHSGAMSFLDAVV